MDIVQKWLFPTIKQFKVLLLLYDKKRITFKDQEIFANQQCFRIAMERLVNFGVISREESLNNDMRKNNEIYKMNFKGFIWVEKTIIEYNEKNGIKCT